MKGISIETYLKRVRAREPRLYESSGRTVDTWSARQKVDDTIAPDGLPYSLGPKARAPYKTEANLRKLIGLAPKVSLSDITTQYEQDLKESDA